MLVISVEMERSVGFGRKCVVVGRGWTTSQRHLFAQVEGPHVPLRAVSSVWTHL